MKKAFRFGVVTAGNPSSSEWIARVRHIEELGYSSVLVPDAMGTPLSTIVALTAAASATTTLRVGSYVFVNDYRNPALLAREIVSLDQVSGGRVELGVGVGNWPNDFEQLGIPMDKPGVRVSRFEEGLSIIKQFFAGETFSFSGKYYTATNLRPASRPVQQPIPILFGSFGRRMVTLAAREADIILLFPPVEERITWIREAAGDRFEQLEFAQNGFGLEVTDSTPVPPSSFNVAQVETRAMTTEQTVAYLLEQRERFGISYIHIQERQVENFAPVVAQLSGE